MKITFLGTGTSQGIPVIGSNHPVCLSNNPKDKRLRVSVMLEWEDNRYVIDCGPDFRQQMLTHNVSKINGILFTHEHNDHIIGLDDVRPFYFRQGKISVYAHQRVVKALKKRFDYVFEEKDKYPGAPEVEVIELNGEPFRLQHMPVTPINVLHNQLQVFGFRFDEFAYITDAKTINKQEKNKIKGLKVLVINALRREPHHSHLNLDEALSIIEELQPERAYLTHISHLLGFHDSIFKFGYESNDFSNLKIYASHGSVDQVLPIEWARKNKPFLDQLGIENQYSEFPVGHGVNPDNFREFKAWLANN